jgi:hypothetical protein
MTTPTEPPPPPTRLTGCDQPDDEDEVYQQARDLVSWAVDAGLITRPTGTGGKPPAQPMKATVEAVEASGVSSE